MSSTQSTSGGASVLPQARATGEDLSRVRPTPVDGVTLHRFAQFRDHRGGLTVGEFAQHIPFVPQRYFLVYDVPAAEVRGQHAHRECHQFLVCVRGSCTATADDGVTQETFVLDSPATGLYMPPMTWGSQREYSADAVLLVFASHSYDPADYMDDYAEWRQARIGRTNGTPAD
jgi:UDP-2-acetamido-3-amino-2,3-dideoxy-glucuronate N-acetyltransferase